MKPFSMTDMLRSAAWSFAITVLVAPLALCFIVVLGSTAMGATGMEEMFRIMSGKDVLVAIAVLTLILGLASAVSSVLDYYDNQRQGRKT